MLDHSFNWISRQAGKYLNFYSKFMSDSEIVERLRHNDHRAMPSRLHIVDEFTYQQAMLGNYFHPQLQLFA